MTDPHAISFFGAIPQATGVWVRHHEVAGEECHSESFDPASCIFLTEVGTQHVF